MAQGYDHDHETDIVRAALCTKHNSSLGGVGDSPASLRVVADWLEGANKGFTFSEATRARKVPTNAKWYAAHPDYFRLRRARIR